MTKETKQVPTHILKRPDVEQKISELLGDQKKSRAFLTSALSVIQSNKLLKEADQTSIYQACMTAVTLDLPINPNLGYAYIVPYKGQAQFQIGYKGLIQLCWRSGQFKTISSTEVYEGQLVEQNPLTGFLFDWDKKSSDKVIGYAAYFELMNGANKTFYMTTKDVEAHAKKYSQSYKKGFGVWKDDFDSMARKTVLKLLLSKYAPMSVEMQKATLADQAVVNNFESDDYQYADNDKGHEYVKAVFEESAMQAAIEQIKTGKSTLEDIEEIYELTDEQRKTLQHASV
jgi:recombination protein RecT